MPPTRILFRGSGCRFAPEPVMRLHAAEPPPGTVDIHDDGQRSPRVLGPQDAKSQMHTGTACNGQVFNVDRVLANPARLRLIEASRPCSGPRVNSKGDRASASAKACASGSS